MNKNLFSINYKGGILYGVTFSEALKIAAVTGATIYDNSQETAVFMPAKIK